MNKLLIRMILLTGLLGATAIRADITLVDDGVAKATIVVAKAALSAPTEVTLTTYGLRQPATNKIAAAAHELRVYVEKMTGAKLPIVGDDQAPAQGPLILVGKSALTKVFDARIPSGKTPTCDEEGYAIIAKGDRLILAGNDEAVYHGTEYAVAALLHRFGVRWYMPGNFGDFVPKQETLKVGDLNIVSRPDFKMRNWWCGLQPADMNLLEYRWKIRNGMNPIGRMVETPTDGQVRDALPPPAEIDNKDFADVWGKTTAGLPNEGMPNLTSEKSVQYGAERIKESFREHPDVYSAGLAGDDGLPVDYSPKTMERNLGLPCVGGRIGVISELSITEEWMDWVQAVAKEVYKEFPDHFLIVNGYANRTDPPIGVTPDPKIWIMFAAIWSDTMHAYDNPRSWQTLRQGKMIKQWASMYNNVYMYDYTYFMLAGCGAPIPLAHKHMHDMPLLKKWGVIGFGDEGRTVRGESGVFPTYLRARMMWDADLDAKKEMREFFDNWYGPASAPAMAFWEELENTFETTPWLGHEDRILPYVYSQKLIDKLEKYVKKAEALAVDPWNKPRVLADRVTLEHLKAFMAMSRADFDADFAEAAKQAQRMVDVRKPATELSRWYFDPQPPTGESAGYYYWGSVARRDYYQKMAALTGGANGEMVAVFPEKVKSTIDPRDDGRYDGWYAADFRDKGWESILTTMPFYQQAEGCVDEQGFPYMGVMWYRMTVDVPASAKGKKVFIYAPAVETEAWVWMNGQLVGHRPYIPAYVRPNEIDMDVTQALKPGERNCVAIRVHTGLNAAQAGGGLSSRVFLYAIR